jgi:aminoglycoside 6-adenylyltransferase
VSASMGFESLEAAFVRWARDEVEVRAVIAVGSRARVEPPADDWSDLDLMVYTRAPDRLLENTDWLDQVGRVCIVMPGRTASGEPEILVMFDGGFDVDVVVGRIEDLAGMARAGMVPHGHLRGARVLVDKDGWAAARFPHPSVRPVRPIWTRRSSRPWYRRSGTARTTWPSRSAVVTCGWSRSVTRS